MANDNIFTFFLAEDFCLHIVENVTEGVYGMGFARSQKAYEEAYEKFF